MHLAFAPSLKTSKIVWLMVCMCHMTLGGKLEKWLDPSFSGSVEPSALRSASRNPKFFLGTTTTVTSTLTTTTACYTTAGTPSSSCSKKKKRSISDEPIKGLEDAKNIMPSSGTRTKEENLHHVDDNFEKLQPNNNVSRRNSKLMDLNKLMVEDKEMSAEPRFLAFYFYTSTVTSTSTSFSKTTTFTITACTPAGSFVYAACG